MEKSPFPYIHTYIYIYKLHEHCKMEEEFKWSRVSDIISLEQLETRWAISRTFRIGIV